MNYGTYIACCWFADWYLLPTSHFHPLLRVSRLAVGTECLRSHRGTTSAIVVVAVVLHSASVIFGSGLFSERRLILHSDISVIFKKSVNTAQRCFRRKHKQSVEINFSLHKIICSTACVRTYKAFQIHFGTCFKKIQQFR